MKIFFMFLSMFIFQNQIQAENSSGLQVKQFRKANEKIIIKELMNFVKLPNDSRYSTPTNSMAGIEDIKKNAEYLKKLMQDRGIQNVRFLGVKGKDVPVSVYGEIIVPGATQTVILYAHFDGMPVKTENWKVTKPWEPVLAKKENERISKLDFENLTEFNPEWRIYGRSTSDDKAGIISLLYAVEALKKNNIKFTSNLKFFFEGEEEALSPNFEDILKEHKELLSSDLWVVLDGPSSIGGEKQVFYGVRGVKNIDITVYGANRPLHSGHFGNWAPNPNIRLSHLLSSMVNLEGKVTIKNFYNDTEKLTHEEKRSIDIAARPDEKLKKEFGLCQPDGQGERIDNLINRPSLNVRGLSGGEVLQKATNIVPPKSIASLDLRIAAGNEASKQVKYVTDHIRNFLIKQKVKEKMCFIEIDESHTEDREPNQLEREKCTFLVKVNIKKGGYDAQKLSLTHPLANRVVDALQRVLHLPIRKLPISGASLPTYLVSKILNAPLIYVTMNNYDNNQHTEDENIRIQNLWDGIDMSAAIMTMN